MSRRRWVQIIATLAANPFVPGLIQGKIFQGKTKGLCFPGLNCYSCPLALYSCPIGNLQTFMAKIPHRISFYTIGFIGAIGAVGGRVVCGWICPFGLMQELLHKIPTRKFRIPRFLNYGKYVTLVVLVLMVPAITHENWFSRLCPAGTLEAGIPLVSADKSLRAAIGWFFWLKIAILVAFLIWMVLSRRPFCRTTCPLGAIYGLLNPVSIYKMDVDGEKCTNCEECVEVCPVDMSIMESPNSPECIRCLKCVKACPEGAIKFTRKRRSRPAPGSLSEESA